MTPPRSAPTNPASARIAPTHVALLRGINVGGATRVPMATVRDLAEHLGLADVGTVLNSGNLLFSAGDFRAGDMSGVAVALERALEAAIGFAPPVVIRRVDLMPGVLDVARREFPGAERKSLVGVFLSGAPPVDLEAAFADFPEEFRHGPGDVLVAHYVNGQARSKLDAARLERILGVDTATARNINTIEKLAGYTNS